LIANTLGLSIFWYQATLFDIPKTVIFRINKILFPFVWDKKREWMARSSVTQPLAQGGLGVVDAARKLLSLRAVWLRRYFSPHPWLVFFDFYVSLHFGHPVPDVLARAHIPAYLVKKLPSFYASVLRAWIALCGISDDTFATLVSRSMPCGRRAPLHDGTRVREGTARVPVGEHRGLVVLGRRVIKRLSTS
jgi:hypothetical protein